MPPGPHPILDEHAHVGERHDPAPVVVPLVDRDPDVVDASGRLLRRGVSNSIGSIVIFLQRIGGTSNSWRSSASPSRSSVTAGLRIVVEQEPELP